MPRRAKRAAIELPDYVFPVTSRGKVYYYFQKGRGGKSPGPRHRIEGDPHSSQFWIKYRELMGEDHALPALTVSEAIDRMLMEYRAKGTMKSQSIRFYDQSSRVARKAWGDLSPSGLRPKHVETVFDSMRFKTGAANNFLSFMRAFGKWMRKNDLTMFQLTEGLSAHKAKDGHRPWTAEQLATAEAKLTGAVRRGFFLYRYTGLRGSDVVRLGPEHVVDGGFEIVTQKRSVPILCPILPELAAEMANWEAGEGPFLRQQGGGPMAGLTHESCFRSTSQRSATRSRGFPASPFMGFARRPWDGCGRAASISCRYATLSECHASWSSAIPAISTGEPRQKRAWPGCSKQRRKWRVQNILKMQNRNKAKPIR